MSIYHYQNGTLIDPEITEFVTHGNGVFSLDVSLTLTGPAPDNELFFVVDLLNGSGYGGGSIGISGNITLSVQP